MGVGVLGVLGEELTKISLTAVIILHFCLFIHVCTRVFVKGSSGGCQSKIVSQWEYLKKMTSRSENTFQLRVRKP